MPKFVQSSIDEVLRRCDLPEIASSYMQLRRNGTDFVGLCPFHREKTPSFHISADKQLFYCFGCGSGGNLIDFIKKIENLDFVDTIRFLAERSGVTLEEEVYSPEVQKKHDERERIYKMNKLAAKALNSMMSGFFQEKSNKDIMITGAYISKNQQNLMYNQALENSIKITKGGYSEHHTGLAVDMSIYSEKENLKPFSPVGKYEWIKENCTKYGFVRRYPPEKSDITGIKDHFEHFRYVGIPHAYYMTENNLTLEEYIELLKNYTFGNKSLSFSCYSKNYEVYYIKAKSSGGNVDVYVPSTNSYTISGNNVDGFIITVEK